MSTKLLKKGVSSHPLKRFQKRSLNWKILKNLLFQLGIDIKNLVQPKLEIEFMERIMLAVTSVNKCRYCSYFHTKVALENGCSDEEIRDILGGNFRFVNQNELYALVFAQHFAESYEQPSREALKRLIKIYGIKKTRQIVFACQMITLGNLFGNTIDAYIHRYHGIIPDNGSLTLERIIYYISAIPVLKLEKSLKKFI